MLFVDFGNTLIIRNKSVLEIFGSAVEQIPFLGLECRLANIGPIDSSWSVESVYYFSQQVLGNFCLGEVYSVVDSAVHLKLVCDSEVINDKLVEVGYATSAAETYLSRVKIYL